MTITDLMMTRRTALAGLAASTALPLRAAPASLKLVAGTYANEGGKGLYPIHLDPGSGGWQVGAPVTPVRNASFGVRGPKNWYLVEEGAHGLVGAWHPDWTAAGGASTGGADPCHAALDPDARALAVANYSSGSVAFYRLDARGRTGEPTLFQHRGHGPDTDRQQGPHAHWVGFSPDRRWLHAVDLGADAIFAYAYDARARTLSPPTIAWQAPAGSGPRHLMRHPRLPRAYVVCEMGNLLVTLDRRDDGGFATRATQSTLPAGFSGASQAAHIAIDAAAQRLYVSNRGADTIAVFALDEAGDAIPIQHVASGGHWPRLFLPIEERREMLVANERSGEVAILAIRADGTLSPTRQRLAIPGVVFLARS